MNKRFTGYTAVIKAFSPNILFGLIDQQNFKAGLIHIKILAPGPAEPAPMTMIS
jgi:hypothetical protein